MPGIDALGPDDALIAVDVQIDFCPGGALPIPEGDRVVPTLNGWIEGATRAGATIVASRDWHPRRHPSFEGEGGPWPEHCVQDTSGAAFHPDLKLPGNAVLVSKGTRFDKDQYSAFDETGLGDFLRTNHIRRVFVGGLALDVCVRATALGARSEGFETVLITDASRPVAPEDAADAIDAMQDAGVLVD